MVFGAIACLTIVPGQAEFLGTIYAFGAMLSFTIAHVAVCALRITQPGRRAARTAAPGNVRIGGTTLPLLVGGRRHSAPGIALRGGHRCSTSRR